MSSVAPLLAFELVSPAMLGWLAAAAAPFLIHLWSRRRYREMPWAAMEYLLAAVRNSRRWIHVEQWLLLALRTLLIVLLVLAMAEPVINRGGLAAPRGQRTHRVFVLDGSFSMGYRPSDKTRFQRAKEMAARIVEESPEGDGFTLLLLAVPPRVVVGRPAFESRSFLREIEALELPHGTADLPRTLAAVEEVLTAARQEAPRLTREVVYFLTDLGRVGWSLDGLDPAAKAEFHERSRRLADRAAFQIVDLGQPDAENTALVGLHPLDPVALLARDFNVRAEVKHFGRRAAEEVAVELLVDGRPLHRKQVRLDTDGKGSVPFSCRFESPGDHAVEARIEGDRLEIDNHRWLSVPVRDALRVLIIGGGAAGGATWGAADYLAAALAPRSDQAGRATVRAEIRPESALAETNLGPFDAVFLAGIPQFTAAEARILDAYLKRGGNLVFFLGPQVLPERYNRELAGSAPDKPRILPATLGPLLGPQTRVDPLGYRHPVVRAFQGQERAGLLDIPVGKYFQLILPPNSQARSILALPDGNPLLVEEPIHRGRVFLVATSADPSWTALPVWTSFLPLVQEMLSYAVAGGIEKRNVRVGEPLGETLPLAASATSFSLRLPSGRTEEGRVHAEGDASVWIHPDTPQSGLYSVRFGAPLARTDVFAANVEPAESDLTPLAPERLRDDVWPGVEFLHQTRWQSPETSLQASIAEPNALSRQLLASVLVLLLLETFLARRFGHYAS